MISSRSILVSNDGRGNGREIHTQRGSKVAKRGAAEVVRRGVHPVRFNVISRVPSLPPSLVLLSFHSSPTPSLPQSAFLLVHPQPRRHHSPPHLTTRPPGIFNLRKPSSERTKERRKEGGGREMDEEAGRRREEGGWSRGWKSIPLGGVTSRAQLARARVSFRRGFRILAAVDWRFLRFRFSPPPRWRQPVMHTVREPDLRPPSPASPGLLPTAHRSSSLSLSLCSSPSPGCFSSFFTLRRATRASARRPSPASRRKRECIIQFSSRYFTI